MKTKKNSLKTEHIGLFYEIITNTEVDVRGIYNQKEALILSIAKKLKLKDFEIVSEGISFYNETGNEGRLSFHIDIEFLQHDEAINAFVKESGAVSLNSSRYNKN